jgi:O-antigen/teichoic acid export membrane protein
MLVTGSMALAWMPRAMEMKNEAGAGLIYRRMFTAYVSTGFVIVSFLIVFRSLILRFFAPGYEEAAGIISILSVFNFLMGFVYVFTIGIQLSAKTKVVTTSAVAAIATKIILSYALVGNFGMTGLAWASLAESIVWISFQHYFSQKLHPIPFDYKVLLFLPLFFIIAWLTGIVESGASEFLLLPLLFILSSVPALVVFYLFAYRNGRPVQ